jgi:hypothetical protein
MSALSLYGTCFFTGVSFCTLALRLFQWRPSSILASQLRMPVGASRARTDVDGRRADPHKRAHLTSFEDDSMASAILTCAGILMGYVLLLAWIKQVSSYVLGFSLADRSAWPQLSFSVGRLAASHWAAGKGCQDQREPSLGQSFAIRGPLAKAG